MSCVKELAHYPTSKKKGDESKALSDGVFMISNIK